MNLYVINDGGFAFGMDYVTPVAWCIKRKHAHQVYTQWRLTDEQAANARNVFADVPVVFATYRQMADMISGVGAPNQKGTQ